MYCYWCAEEEVKKRGVDKYEWVCVELLSEHCEKCNKLSVAYYLKKIKPDPPTDQYLYIEENYFDLYAIWLKAKDKKDYVRLGYTKKMDGDPLHWRIVNETGTKVLDEYRDIKYKMIHNIAQLLHKAGR